MEVPPQNAILVTGAEGIIGYRSEAMVTESSRRRHTTDATFWRNGGFRVSRLGVFGNSEIC